jgi:hypothetical protein
LHEEPTHSKFPACPAGHSPLVNDGPLTNRRDGPLKELLREKKALRERSKARKIPAHLLAELVTA